MQIKEFIDGVCEQIKYKPIRQNIAEELKNHIEDAKEEFLKEGMEEKLAEEKAITEMGDAEEIGKQLNKIHKPKLDWKLVVLAVILISFGLVVSIIRSEHIVPSTMKFIFFLIIGVIISLAIYFVDYKKLNKCAGIIYIIATFSIVFTFLKGIMINGIPHLSIGYITFSPTAIAVPLYIIAFAGFLQNIDKENKVKMQIYGKNINMNVVKIIVLSIISLVILMEIPSVTSAFILFLTYMIMASIKLKNKKYIAILWIVPIIGVMLILTPYNRVGLFNRIQNSFNPELDPQGVGWLGVNRKQIINSAKIFGEAENMSDAIELFDEGTNFAFISILAHYGWAASLGIAISVLLFSFKLVMNYIKLKDSYGKMLTIGIGSMFILQSIFNILMNLNLWLETNFNLPFVSYGGVNLIMNILSLSLILSIYRKKDIVENRCVKEVIE